ncbi:MAG: S9 family peptidase [Gemmatimonadales bacterium]|nr:MAG: S9 family peptidase [Gemmatimonadales bacterium]
MSPQLRPVSRQHSRRSLFRHGARLPAAALFLAVGVLAGAPTAGIAQSQAQESDVPEGDRLLGHHVYEEWRTIGSRGLAPRGDWVHYTLELENADGELVVRSVDSDREHRVERGAAPRFTADGRRVVFRIRPHGPDAASDPKPGNARGNRNAVRDSLGILEVESGRILRFPALLSFQLPEEGGEWVAFHQEAGHGDEGNVGMGPPSPGEPTTEATEAGIDSDSDSGEDPGTLVLLALETGEEARFRRVEAYALSRDGGRLAFVARQGDLRQVRVLVPGAGDPHTVLETDETLSGLTLDRDGERLALRAVAEEGNGEDDPNAGRFARIVGWQAGDSDARTLADGSTSGMRGGWGVSPHHGISFSAGGDRLLLGTRPPAPARERDPEWSHPLDDQVDVEIWHWQDDELMTVQNVRRTQRLRQSYQAVLFLGEDRIVQLADPTLPSVSVGGDGDGRLAVGSDPTPYAVEASWESPNPRDLYLVEVATGERRLLVEGARGGAAVSPDEAFVTWYHGPDSTWYAHEVATGETRAISADLPHPVHNEDHDLPQVAGSYGSAGWLEGDEAILLYDRYDVWQVDPRGAAAPIALTAGEGRSREIRFRAVALDPDRRAVAPSEPLLLSAFHEPSRDAGFFRMVPERPGAPDELILESRRFSTPVQAREAHRLLFTQETFRDFPDLWVAGPEFGDRVRISEANPQQAEYRWGTAEIVSWTSADGTPLDGILMKPDDFDPSGSYPVLVYFYDRQSERLHSHYAPVPHRSIINFPMYTSHGYVVFIPDIVYREGYPGESAFNAVVSGTQHLLREPWVDRERIGLQGHSWGGYQIAFIVTRSQRLFRAAAAGAPVANMTSAYGQIRWETGLVRQFQYERTQSRLGGSLWERPLRYLENSPLFWADKIETPLLIMHNDNDGHVPWEQGIELFTALRRLDRAAWLVNYRGEPHWPTTFANRRDWNIRMKQFFDHFLHDAAPPRWMVEGIPAEERGETLGYEEIPGAQADGGRRR